LSALPIDHYRWEKYGLVYDVKSNPAWGKTHALVPSPVVLNNEIVRIYCSFVDNDFRGRIGYVDVNLSDGHPEIIHVSEKPVLDLGPNSTFSQYGVGMGTFWPNHPEGDLYFVGFDRPAGFKFKAFSGKAHYDSQKMTHVHSQNEPFFGSDYGGETIVGVHDIFEFQNLTHALISIGSGFQNINGKDFPKYQVHLASGTDLKSLEISKEPIIEAIPPVYRIGRPRIYETKNGLEILVTAGDLSGNYLPRAFYSKDLVSWVEGSCQSFVKSVVNGFDDMHQCYLSRFNLNNTEYIVYNGNLMGVKGFGIAKGVK
jgi:hypothetical protein